MPADMEEQGLAKVPDLELAQLKFEVAHGLGGDKNLLKIIKENKMASSLELMPEKLISGPSDVSIDLPQK